MTNHVGDWDIDLLHVEGVVATSVGSARPTYGDQRCTYFGAPATAAATTGTVSTTVPAVEYNIGFTAVIPGLGCHELLLGDNATPAPSSTHPVTTKELWASRQRDPEAGQRAFRPSRAVGLSSACGA